MCRLPQSIAAISPNCGHITSSLEKTADLASIFLLQLSVKKQMTLLFHAQFAASLVSLSQRQSGQNIDIDKATRDPCTQRQQQDPCFSSSFLSKMKFKICNTDNTFVFYYLMMVLLDFLCHKISLFAPYSTANSNSFKVTFLFPCA